LHAFAACCGAGRSCKSKTDACAVAQNFNATIWVFVDAEETSCKLNRCYAISMSVFSHFCLKNRMDKTSRFCLPTHFNLIPSQSTRVLCLMPLGDCATQTGCARPVFFLKARCTHPAIT
jgi:hypothetical protein